MKRSFIAIAHEGKKQIETSVVERAYYSSRGAPNPNHRRASDPTRKDGYNRSLLHSDKLYISGRHQAFDCLFYRREYEIFEILELFIDPVLTRIRNTSIV